MFRVQKQTHNRSLVCGPLRITMLQSTTSVSHIPFIRCYEMQDVGKQQTHQVATPHLGTCGVPTHRVSAARFLNFLTILFKCNQEDGRK